jgi:hypothetical protein
MECLVIKTSVEPFAPAANDRFPPFLLLSLPMLHCTPMSKMG